MKIKLCILFLLLIPQILYSQNLNYSVCTNCDNNLGNEYNGNMVVPESGFTYGNIQSLNDNPNRVVSDFGRREADSR